MEDIIETSPAHYVTYLRIYGAVVLVVVLQLDLQLHMQSVSTFPKSLNQVRYRIFHKIQV